MTEENGAGRNGGAETPTPFKIAGVRVCSACTFEQENKKGRRKKKRGRENIETRGLEGERVMTDERARERAGEAEKESSHQEKEKESFCRKRTECS